MDVLILLLSLVLITAGAEALVRGASAIALRTGLSPLFVGLTIVGFGTSSPELGASLAATLKGASDVSVGNVVGSNIFNIAVILGITAAVKPVRIGLGAVRRDLVVAAAAACVPWTSLPFGAVIPRWLGGVLVGILFAYLWIAFRTARRAQPEEKALASAELESVLGVSEEPPRRARDRLPVNVGLVAVGLVLLVAGSQGFVGAAIDLARSQGVSELVIGLTLVSAGTSLPELVTSVVAARRGNPDIAVGNVLGSNLFNAFGILGTCAVVSPQAVSPFVLRIDTGVTLIATLALFPFLRSGGVLSRKEGAALLLGYGVYLTTLLLRG